MKRSVFTINFTLPIHLRQVAIRVFDDVKTIFVVKIGIVRCMRSVIDEILKLAVKFRSIEKLR